MTGKEQNTGRGRHCFWVAIRINMLEVVYHVHWGCFQEQVKCWKVKVRNSRKKTNASDTSKEVKVRLPSYLPLQSFSVNDLLWFIKEYKDSFFHKQHVGNQPRIMTWWITVIDWMPLFRQRRDRGLKGIVSLRELKEMGCGPRTSCQIGFLRFFCPLIKL